MPRAADEAHELYRKGAQTGGPLSRQSGESMREYVQRRYRWYTKLQALDPAVSVSEAIRAQLLLDNANITDMEKLMVMTVVQNKMVFDEIGTCLVNQPPAIHEKEQRDRHRRRDSDKGHTDKGHRKGKFKGFQRYNGGPSNGKNNYSRHYGYLGVHDATSEISVEDYVEGAPRTASTRSRKAKRTRTARCWTPS